MGALPAVPGVGRIFLLYQTERLFNMFPKSAFVPGEIEEFRELALRKLPDK